MTWQGSVARKEWVRFFWYEVLLSFPELFSRGTSGQKIVLWWWVEERLYGLVGLNPKQKLFPLQGLGFIINTQINITQRDAQGRLPPKQAWGGWYKRKGNRLPICSSSLSMGGGHLKTVGSGYISVGHVTSSQRTCQKNQQLTLSQRCLRRILWILWR